MQCIISTCTNDDSNCFSRGITFHNFPTDPKLSAAWLKALNKETWMPLKTSVVCSIHFIKNDLYVDRDGKCRIREGAVPIVNVQDVPDTGYLRSVSKVEACRICFATNCNLYPMSTYNNLDQAYEILTGLSVENGDHFFPPYLCAECAQLLLNCINFRTKSLRAYFILLDIAKNHNQITLESLKAISGKHSLFKSKLSISRNPPNYYNLTIVHNVKNEIAGNKETNEDVLNTIGSPMHIIDNIKLENRDVLNYNNSEDISNDSVYLPSLEIDVECEKIESNDLFNETQSNHSDDNEMNKHKHSDAFDDPEHSEENPQMVKKRERSRNTTREVKKITKATKQMSESDNSDTDNNSCDIRPYKTNNESQLQSYLKLHKNANLLRCYLCSYKTGNKKDLRYHIKTHNGDKIYSCNICNMIFKVRGNLTRHMRVHSDEKPFSCDICKRAFKRQDHYKLHLKVHTGEKPYSCDICNKSFSRQHNYKAHLVVHKSDKLYSCDICKKMFRTKNNLRDHRILHTDQRPFSCQVCNKTFKRNNNLNKHFKLHGKNPYSCDVCKKNFKCKLTLKIHLWLHLDAYKCIECNKTFNQKCSLRSHLKKHF